MHTHLCPTIIFFFSPLAHRPLSPFSILRVFLHRDASDAVRGRDNYDFYGYRLRVEFAKGRRDRNDRERGDRGDRYRDDRRDDRRGDRDRRDDRGDRRGGGRDDRRERGRREFRPRNTAYRVLVKGLPVSASWQDLKDFVKKAVRPVYTDVEKNGEDSATGVVGFESVEDMERCISKLDDTKFSTKDGDKDCYVRVMEDKAYGGGDGDVKKGGSSRRSPSRSRSPVLRKSGSPSPMREASRSRSRSPVARRPPPSRSASPEREQEGSPPRSRSPSQGVDAPV